MRRFFSRLFGLDTLPVPHRPRRALLRLDNLQDRVVPSATVINGVLTLDGTNAADLVIVQREATGYRVLDNGQDRYFSFDSVSANRIVFRGYDGDDRFVNSTGLLSTAYGMNGMDTLIGGGNADQLFGGDGNDTLQGGNGDDLLVGENGNDTLLGERGRDKLLGAFNGWAGEFQGHDTLDGGDENDELWGGDGVDTLVGGNGSDLLAGQGDNDYLYGAFYGWAVEYEGHDHLYGGDGNDVLWGGDGNDLLAGENGSDILNGENGDDWLFGAFYGWAGEYEGHDTLDGGAGSDDLWGGYGNDTLRGQTGEDYLNGEQGNDLIYAGSGQDFAQGGEGNDSILGEDGNDLIYGEAGFDLLYGGGGDDYVYGGDGDDYCFGGNGRDIIYGGNGNDYLNGGYLNFSATTYSGNGARSDWNYDYLYGEAGQDAFDLADKKAPYWWLDSAVDSTSEDEVEWWGWGFSFESPPWLLWGHLYGTQP